MYCQTHFDKFGIVDVLRRLFDKGWHADLSADQLVQEGPDIGDTWRRGAIWVWVGGRGGGREDEVYIQKMGLDWRLEMKLDISWLYQMLLGIVIELDSIMPPITVS